MDTDKLDKFTRQYLVTALWSSNDDSDEQGGDPLDLNYSIEDFSEEALQAAIQDCEKFQAENGHLYGDNESAGHDFWLTRNHHGAGFWDGDYEHGDELTEACKQYGEVWLYVGDDGLLHFA